MSLYTSSGFASAAAAGTDWRDTAKAVLEKLESVRTSEHDFNFGFLYVSDRLAADAQSILNLFKSVLKIEHWVGGVAMGVCGCGESFIDTPAISAMIGRFDPDDFQMIPPIHTIARDSDLGGAQEWLRQNDPMLTLVHGDPMTEKDPALIVKNLEDLCGGFITGGLTSSRWDHAQFADGYHQGGVCGVLFSQRVPVATTLSQGCNIIGETHTITRADGHNIYEINSQNAVEVFENDVRSMVIKLVGKDPDQIRVSENALYDKEEIPQEFHSLFKGEVHAALPISESDLNDYLVRNIMGIDSDNGALVISQHVSAGERILFVHRDHDSVFRDLSASLVALRERVQRDSGTFEPKAAVYISCVARAFNIFEDQKNNEMSLIRDVIGDVPLAGFYAGGEICKGRLYAYTGILTLFL